MFGFRLNFDKPGPGVPKDAPRKRGVGRFFEILSRDFTDLIKLNLLYTLCLLPMQGLLFAALTVSGHIAGVGDASYESVTLEPQYAILFLILLVLSFAAGALIGPGSAAVSYCISKMLRDDPGFLWQDFKRSFKNSVRQTAGFGVVFAIITGSIFIYFYSNIDIGANMNIMLVLICLLALCALALIAPLLFLQAGNLELSARNLLRNSFVIVIGNLPRCLTSGAIRMTLWGIFVIFLPYTILPVILFGYALTNLLSLMWIWPPVDKAFGIEEKIRGK
jgi:uncharacterized membrane protein YesL